MSAFETLTSRVGAEVRVRRRAAGLSQQQLADRCGMHRNQVVELEAGRANPGLRTLQGLADALDAPLADIVAPRGPAGQRGPGS